MVQTGARSEHGRGQAGTQAGMFYSEKYIDFYVNVELEMYSIHGVY